MTINNYNYIHKQDFDFYELCNLIIDKKYELAVVKIKILEKQVSWESLVLDANSYSRNIICNKNGCWLGFLCWDKGSNTSIHGHPDHTFYYVLKGSMLCRYFAGNPLLLTGIEFLHKNDFGVTNGVEGKMNNNIHQLEAQTKSISLNFYSDDPTKGESFGC